MKPQSICSNRGDALPVERNERGSVLGRDRGHVAPADVISRVRRYLRNSERLNDLAVVLSSDLSCGLSPERSLLISTAVMTLVFTPHMDEGLYPMLLGMHLVVFVVIPACELGCAEPEESTAKSTSTPDRGRLLCLTRSSRTGG